MEGLDEYTKHAKSRIDLVSEIRALGGQSELSLPTIAVIGNQSSGKSSLIEAISGVRAPQGAGTCTRCPMEARLRKSEGEWRCQVSLRFETDTTGRRLDRIKEEKFGSLTTDRKAVEGLIRRGQLAILNPIADRAKILALTDQEIENLQNKAPFNSAIPQLEFSSNVVCLDVSSSDVVANLSFIDLPGIISNPGDGRDNRSIEAVRSMIMDHIKNENCLILTTITMRDDIENQSAASLAKDVDPDGSRTIGVLTKPDALLLGEYNRWIDILEGRHHLLRHGYFLTKNALSEKQAGLQVVTGPSGHRSDEHSFFQQTEPWNTCHPTLKARFGSRNLTSALSKHLSHLIDKTLPYIIKDVQQQRTIAAEKLESLPPRPTGTPSIEMINLITKFSHELKHYSEGSPGYEQLVQQCRPVYGAFKRTIRATAPVFFSVDIRNEDEEESQYPAGIENEEDPLERETRSESITSTLSETEAVGNVVPPGTATNPINLLGSPRSTKQNPLTYNRLVAGSKRVNAFLSGSTNGSTVPASGSSTTAFQGFASDPTSSSPFGSKTPFIPSANSEASGLARKKTQTVPPPSPVTPKRRKKETQNSRKRHRGPSFLKDNYEPVQLSIDQMRKHIDSKMSRELPNSVPWSALLSLIQDSIKYWEDAALGCFIVVAEAAEKLTTKLVEEGFPQLALRAAVSDIIHDELQESSRRVKNQLAWFIGLEQRPYTSNEHYLSSFHDKYMTAYRASRSSNNKPTVDEEKAAEAIATLRALGYSVNDIDDLAKLEEPDQFEREMHVGAQVRAYWQVAYKRIIDDIPRMIDHDFIAALGNQMHDALIEKLRAGSEEGYELAKKYLAEDPYVSAQRSELEGKLDRLEKIARKLKAV